MRRELGSTETGSIFSLLIIKCLVYSENLLLTTSNKCLFSKASFGMLNKRKEEGSRVEPYDAKMDLRGMVG